jgi:hypothetical protein
MGLEILFKFFSHGIIALAALGMFLYTMTAMQNRSDVANPLLNLTTVIVVGFLIYMFLKLILRYGD